MKTHLSWYSFLKFLRSLAMLFLIAWTNPLYAQTRQITGFREMMDALNAGEQVRIVIHYARCRLLAEGNVTGNPPDAVASMNIETWEYFAPGAVHNSLAYLVFTDSRLIRNPHGKGFVLDYGKVRINSDNTVKITAQYINPRNYQVSMDESFEGVIDTGRNDGGVFLYTDSR